MQLVFSSALGSEVYGTKVQGSDIDMFDIFIGNKYELSKEKETVDLYYYHFKLFLKKLEINNYRMIEGLFSPVIHHMDDNFAYIRENRHKFLTKKVFETFGVYSMKGFKKWDIKARIGNCSEKDLPELKRNLVCKGIWNKEYFGLQIRHYVRLLGMGIEILKTRDLDLYRPDGDFLLEIKFNKAKFSDMQLVMKEKEKELNYWYRNTKLSDTIDPKVMSKAFSCYSC